MKTEASTPTKETQSNRSSVNALEDICDLKKRKLLKAVKLGLPVECASKIVEMSTPNAKLIIKHYKQ